MNLLITGSSASGKTTLGKLLAEKFAFLHIDGDQVIKELGLTSKAWNSIHDEIIKRSLVQHSQGHVVISHVVLPDSLQRYQHTFASQKIDFQIIILKPTRNTLLARNKTRTCHPKPTPIDVIDFFYAKFDNIDAHQLGCSVIDNSHQTAQKTVKKIIEYCKIQN